jgi:hypothetical protein
LRNALIFSDMPVLRIESNDCLISYGSIDADELAYMCLPTV